MTTLTRKVHNLSSISVSRESLAGDPADFSLARRLVEELLESPRPPKDEWGIAPFRELWVLFTPEGQEPRELPEEVSEEEFHGQWLNAFSTVSPKDEFLAGYEVSLREHLGYLFEGDQFIEKKDHILYRIVAS